jgi:hypothetical protein
LEAGVQRHELIVSERELLEKTLNGSIQLLLDLLAVCEPALFGRAQTLREYMRLYIEHNPSDHNWEFELAAMLSQIAYVTVPSHMRPTTKNAPPLKPSEKEILTRLPEAGAKLVAHIPRLEGVSRILLYQAKNFNGGGFPMDSVMGEQIPIGSRILKVLSGLLELEILGFHKEQALDAMQKRTGWYDPIVLETVFACFDIHVKKSRAIEQTILAVRVCDLQLHEVIMADVYTQDNMLIVPAGTQITAPLLQRLVNFAECNGIKEPIHVKWAKELGKIGDMED